MKRRWWAVALIAVLCALFAIGIVLFRTGPTAAIPATDPVLRLNAEHADVEGNAAPYYKQAIAALNERLPADLWLERVPHDAEVRARVSDWVDKNDAAVDLALQGAAEPKLWIDLPSSSMSSYLPDRTGPRDLARLIAARGWLAVADGDFDTAAESVAAVDALGRQYAGMPTVIDQLISLSIRTLAQRLMLAMFADRDPPIGELRGHFATVERCFEPAGDLASAIKLDAEIGTWNYATGAAGVSNVWLRFLAPPQRFYGEQQRYLGPVLKLLEQPVETWTDPNDPLVVEARTKTGTLPARLNIAATLAHSISGVQLSVIQLAARLVALQRGHWTALQVLAFRSENGDLPPFLAALPADKRLIDPFSGEMFVYRTTGNDFILYSLGLDRDDDGGCHDDRFGEQRGVLGNVGAPDGDYVFWPPARN